MLNKDTVLLEKAYLAIKQPIVNVPSDEDESAPLEVSSDNHVETMPVDVSSEEPSVDISGTANNSDCGCGGLDCNCNEDESVEMAINNLNSIRESIMKISGHCGSGQKLETWAQLKLAIAMDNLASVARSLGTPHQC